MSLQQKRARANNAPALPKVPAFCVHARSGNAYTKFAGRQHWFGKADDPQSRARYQRFVAAVLATGSPPSDGQPQRSYTVADLLADYFERFAQHHYKHLADGQPTSTIATLRLVAKTVLRLFSELQAGGFSLIELRALRQCLIEQGLSLKSVNDRVGHTQRIFGWASSEGLIPSEVGVRLRALRPLPKGRSAAHECPPLMPVDWASVEATLPHLSRQQQAVVRTLWLTGARPSEILQLASRLASSFFGTPATWHWWRISAHWVILSTPGPPGCDRSVGNPIVAGRAGLHPTWRPGGGPFSDCRGVPFHAAVAMSIMAASLIDSDAGIDCRRRR